MSRICGFRSDPYRILKNLWKWKKNKDKLEKMKIFSNKMHICQTYRYNLLILLIVTFWWLKIYVSWVSGVVWSGNLWVAVIVKSWVNLLTWLLIGCSLLCSKSGASQLADLRRNFPKRQIAVYRLFSMIYDTLYI